MTPNLTTLTPRCHALLLRHVSKMVSWIDAHMFGLAWQYQQVSGAVVESVSVHVVHYFPFAQRATKAFSSDNPVDRSSALLQIIGRVGRLIRSTAQIRTVESATFAFVSWAKIELSMTIRTLLYVSRATGCRVTKLTTPAPTTGLTTHQTVIHSSIMITHRWFSPHCLKAEQLALPIPDIVAGRLSADVVNGAQLTTAYTREVENGT